MDNIMLSTFKFFWGNLGITRMGLFIHGFQIIGQVLLAARDVALCSKPVHRAAVIVPLTAIFMSDRTKRHICETARTLGLLFDW